MKKATGIVLSLVLSASVLAACGKKTEDSQAAAEDNKLVLGVTGGPHEEIAKKSSGSSEKRWFRC